MTTEVAGWLVGQSEKIDSTSDVSKALSIDRLKLARLYWEYATYTELARKTLVIKIIKSALTSNLKKQITKKLIHTSFNNIIIKM